MGKRVMGGILALYRQRWQLIGRLIGLRPAEYDVGVERNIPVTMPDGVSLMTDHYYPKAAGKFPTILMRSVYGRGKEAILPVSVFMQFLCRLGAQRGYHVICQTARGRHDSGGDFEPFVDARRDGLATLDWIARQPWFDGSVGMVGGSYLAYVQWAVAVDAPPYLKALVPLLITSRVRETIFQDGAVSLDTALRWVRVLELMAMKGKIPEWKIIYQLTDTAMDADLNEAMNHLPLIEADVPAVGKPVDYYRTWLVRPDPSDPRWQEVDFSEAPPQAEMPIHLMGGWYDIFLRGMLQDYEAMRAAGRQPYLTIGPWTHPNVAAYITGIRESLIWIDAHLKGDKTRLRKQPVSIYVMGANEWRDMDDWPPPSRPTRYYLHARRWLSTDAPEAESSPDHYRYDPANPTPSLHGPLIMNPTGPADNRHLEVRPDVLTYSTPALEAPVEIIGPVKAELYVRSSLMYTDFFARLCDVDPGGRSVNVCDGLFRVEPGKGEPQPDGSLRVEVDMWATAHRFKRGHRIRVLVASGAHPRWSRNLGMGESLATGTKMACADQMVYHDSAHPSAVVLPVVGS